MKLVISISELPNGTINILKEVDLDMNKEIKIDLNQDLKNGNIVWLKVMTTINGQNVEVESQTRVFDNSITGPTLNLLDQNNLIYK